MSLGQRRKGEKREPERTKSRLKGRWAWKRDSLEQLAPPSHSNLVRPLPFPWRQSRCNRCPVSTAFVSSLSLSQMLLSNPAARTHSATASHQRLLPHEQRPRDPLLLDRRPALFHQLFQSWLHVRDIPRSNLVLPSDVPCCYN